jgi:hypothetical protein
MLHSSSLLTLWRFMPSIAVKEDYLSMDSIKASMENAIEYFQSNPDEAPVTDAVATATIENLLRCSHGH